MIGFAGGQNTTDSAICARGMAREELYVIMKDFVHSFNIKLFKSRYVTCLVVYVKFKHHQGRHTYFI